MGIIVNGQLYNREKGAGDTLLVVNGQIIYSGDLTTNSVTVSPTTMTNTTRLMTPTVVGTSVNILVSTLVMGEIDWTASMQQTYEFYKVDPVTWGNSKQLYSITKCNIDMDSSKETLGSASFDCTEIMDESYIRVYLVANQNGYTEKFSLGTFLVQTPSVSFDGMIRSNTSDAYTPLIELKEKLPPVGYFIPKNTKIMDSILILSSENMRAPVVGTYATDVVGVDFVSNLNDTWLSYLTSALNSIDYEFSLDELGRVLFHKRQNIEALTPIWEYNDDNSSILYPSITMSRDLYGVPNVVEIISGGLYVRVINDDPNSPTSTISRGREIVSRSTDPNIIGEVDIIKLTEYANKTLSALSSIEFTVSYTHGYCPVRIGDAVRLNYTRAGLDNIVAKVVSQSITCEPGCPVAETAAFTTNLWR